MSSKQSTADFIIEQLEPAGRVTCRRMFGEYALYLDEKVIALVCDDQLYMKSTKAGRDYIGDPVEAAPFPGAKNWFLVTGDLWDDRDWLCGLVRVSLPEIPKVKKKSPRAKTKRKKA